MIINQKIVQKYELKAKSDLVRQQLSLSSRSYESCTRTAKDSLRASSVKENFLRPSMKERVGQECA